MTLAITFLSTPTLLFLSLGLVPLIIHLLSRRRWRVIRWAAMEFLLRAMRKHRRRLRIENLLLILVRTLAIVCLVLACARPYAEEKTVPLAQAAGASTIFAFDVSYSMAYEEEGQSVLDRAKELARARLSSMTQADRVVILQAADRARVLFDDNATDDARLRANKFLDEMGTAATGLDVAMLLNQLLRTCEDLARAGLPVKIEFYTDLQAADWHNEEGLGDPQVRESLAALKQSTASFRLVDVAAPDGRGRRDRVNVGLVDLRLDRTLAATDVPVTVLGTVRNWSSETLSSLAVDLLVDGHHALGRSLTLPPGESRSVSFRYAFREPGAHAITLEVRSDGLQVDNRRYLAVNVRKEVRVLLVDGEDAAAAIDRETFYLEAALAPRDDPLMEALSPFRVDTVPAGQLTAQAIRRNDAVVFANVNRVTVGSALRDSLRRGGAALFFLGSNVDADFYNRELFGPEGGLAPIQLTRVAGDPNRQYSVVMEPKALEHPVIRFFMDENARLDRPPVYRFYRTEVKEGAQVLATYRDPSALPAIIESSFGQGKVVVVTTTADEQWTTFPKWPDFVPLLYELLAYMVSPSRFEKNLLVGWSYERKYPAVAYAASVGIRPPRGGTTRTSLTNREEGDDGDFQLFFQNTEEPGIYEITLSRQRSIDELLKERYPERDCFAVNVVSAEGDLTATSEAGLRVAYGDSAPQVVLSAGTPVDAMAAGPVRQNLWRLLLYAMLAFFVTEAACAAVFGRRQR